MQSCFALSTLQRLSPLSHNHPAGKVRTVRLRDVEPLALGHTAGERTEQGLNPELKACALAVELWDSLWGYLGKLQGMNVFKLELKTHICPLPSALLLCYPWTPRGRGGGRLVGYLGCVGHLGRTCRRACSSLSQRRKLSSAIRR